MAETPSKRLRQEPHASETLDLEDESNSKRQKPYNNILSLLDEEEENEEQNQDLSAIFTTLQQELSSTTAASFDFDSRPLTTEDDSRRHQNGEEDEGVKSVMRHLLEASDDELGIPNYTEENNNVQIKSDENISLNFFYNGLWEFEDVAANYYTVLQSELFM
ncbi:hypothetical protein C2S51_030114 [Perilla frutescens var. frutescens]|nr:hypothetical protein C2S51_030114 [Perilla frutescens var. frutescens]